jgi:thiol-disulfide isomerase/thioredoxin
MLRLVLLVVLTATLGAAGSDETCTLSVPQGATLEWKCRAGNAGHLKLKKVESGSPAAGLGYRAGDEIVAIGGVPVSDKDLGSILDLSRGGGGFRTQRSRQELELPALFQATNVLESHEHGLKPGDRAPAIPVYLRDGRLADALDVTQGHVVLITFWAVWCGPCMAEMPLLAPLQKKYAERGLVVLALNVDEDKAQANRYLEEHPPGVQVVMAGGMATRQADSYRVEGIPLNVLVDRSRRIAQVRAGYAPGRHEELLSRAVEMLLDANDPPVLVVRR